jgi:hypothetical protein
VGRRLAAFTTSGPTATAAGWLISGRDSSLRDGLSYREQYLWIDSGPLDINLLSGNEQAMAAPGDIGYRSNVWTLPCGSHVQLAMYLGNVLMGMPQH